MIRMTLWSYTNLTDVAARSVWDMFRPARLVSNVRVLTRRDVNVEKLRPEDTMRLPE